MRRLLHSFENHVISMLSLKVEIQKNKQFTLSNCDWIGKPKLKFKKKNKEIKQNEIFESQMNEFLAN